MKRLYAIHGWTYSLDKWTALADELKRRDIELVLLKVPGLTETSDKVWDIDGYVEWLRGQLYGIKNPVVIGHSNGGRIALNYALRYPGSLSRLILIDSAGIAHDQLLPRAKRLLWRMLAKVGKIIAWLPGVKRVFYRAIGATDYNQAPPNMKLTMRNMLASDIRADYTCIQEPVLLIWGRDDTITPLADGRKLSQLLKKARLEVIDGARHAPQATHPEQVAALIEAAL